jgi:uncharacterized protein YkwD
VHRFALLLCVASVASFSLAGCGSSDSNGDRAGGPALRTAPSGKLSVGVTEAHLGDATADAGRGREQRLSHGGRVDPGATRPPAGGRDGVAGGASCPGAELSPDASNVATVSTATLCLLNGERADRGLTALSVDRDLERAALRHADDMVEHDYFSHSGRDGSQIADRIRATGYLRSEDWIIGENLAWGTGSMGSAKSIVSAWMASSGHRANILKAGYREIGLGVVAGNPAGGSGGATYASEFGTVRGSDQAAVKPGARSQRAAKAKSRRARARRARARRARVALSPGSSRARIVGRALVAGAAGLRAN